MGSLHVDAFPPCSLSPCVDPEKQLLPNIIDGLAATKPLAAYGYYPISPDGYHQGFRKLSYRDFANVVNGLAWWITAQLGRSNSSCSPSSSSSQEALTYTGPNDFRQNAMILACYKAGYKLLLASPRNQPSALQSLLKEVRCKAVLAADPNSPFASVIVQAAADSHGDGLALPCFPVPSMDTLLANPFPHYPCHKTLQDSTDDTLVILHTSGTTASPKPIAYTNGWVAAYIRMLRSPPPPASPVSPSMQSTTTTAASMLLPPHHDAKYNNNTASSPPGWEMKDNHLRGTRLLVMMPPFHAANLFCTSFLPPADETVIILPPANQLLPTTESFVQGIQSTTSAAAVDTAFVPPHMISQIATNPDFLDAVTAAATKSSLTIVSGGAKIVEAHGDAVDSRLRSSSGSGGGRGGGRLLTLYGATETGSIPDMMPPLTGNGNIDDNTWNYISPHPAAGWQFRLLPPNNVSETSDDENHQNQNKIYEAWIVRPPSLSSSSASSSTGSAVKNPPSPLPPVFSLLRGQRAENKQVDEYSTKDLFTPHLTIPNLWRWHGRTDDTIVLSTGANISPVAMEDGVMAAAAAPGLSLPSSVKLTAVLMAGTGHPRPVLLVEVTAPPATITPATATTTTTTTNTTSAKDVKIENGTADDGHDRQKEKNIQDDAANDSLLDHLWRIVERMNNQYYFIDHRIRSKKDIIVVQGGGGHGTRLGMVRSLKGAVQRAATVERYRGEIEHRFREAM